MRLLSAKLWRTVASLTYCDEGKPQASYDHVIVGYGAAGQAALAQLERGRRVLVVDPHHAPVQSATALAFARTTVTALDAAAHVLTLADGRRVHYGNALIATGLYPPATPLASPTLTATATAPPSILREWTDDPSFPGVLDLSDPAAVALLTSLVEQGRHVTILGGRWEPTAVALRLAQAARQRGYTKSVTLVCPQAGPMYHHLPRYLSVALARRLATNGVEVRAPGNSRRLFCAFLNLSTKSPIYRPFPCVPTASRLCPTRSCSSSAGPQSRPA